MGNWHKIQELAMDLEEYAELENDELSEASTLLISLHGYEGYLSEEFIVALGKEIQEQLTNYQENTIMVTETITPEPYVRTSLDWV